MKLVQGGIIIYEVGVMRDVHLIINCVAGAVLVVGWMVFGKSKRTAGVGLLAAFLTILIFDAVYFAPMVSPFFSGETNIYLFSKLIVPALILYGVLLVLAIMRLIAYLAPNFVKAGALSARSNGSRSEAT